MCAGFLQATGWPSVVAVMANWYGKGKRGAVMGEPLPVTCVLSLKRLYPQEYWLQEYETCSKVNVCKTGMRPTAAAAHPMYLILLYLTRDLRVSNHLHRPRPYS